MLVKTFGAAVQGIDATPSPSKSTVPAASASFWSACPTRPSGKVMNASYQPSR